jgi:hypothetical protein
MRIRRVELERLLEQVVAYLVPVDQPLVLISQIQRSGGTLVSQLLDGHRELHVHPAELQIGFPKKTEWPVLDLEASPKEHLATLQEKSHARLFDEGYRKRMREHEQYDDELFPFFQPPSLVASLFRELVPRAPGTSREVLDAYFTAYFNAWLDNRHLRDGPKRWIAAFTPRLAWGESRGRLIDDYPDGRLIQILRDPSDWYVSARAHHPRYADCEQAIGEWRTGVLELIAAARERPEQTLVLAFEDIVAATEPSMELVADWLGIEFTPQTLLPTFNELPIRADSSFAVSSSGVLPDVLGRGRSLPRDDAELIDRMTRDVHEEAMTLLQRPA